jgi:hypothetical protein
MRIFSSHCCGAFARRTFDDSEINAHDLLFNVPHGSWNARVMLPLGETARPLMFAAVSWTSIEYGILALAALGVAGAYYLMMRK